MSVSGYDVIEGMHPVPGFAPDLKTRFRWRAERRARLLNAQRIFPSYRYEATRTGNRWWVIVYQNYARSR